MPFKYIGDGRFVAGLPARDLDDHEVSAELAAQIDDGDTDEGPTPIYKRMTKKEEAAYRAAQKAEAEAEAPADEPETDSAAEGG